MDGLLYIWAIVVDLWTWWVEGDHEDAHPQGIVGDGARVEDVVEVKASFSRFLNFDGLIIFRHYGMAVRFITNLAFVALSRLSLSNAKKLLERLNGIAKVWS